MHNSVIESPGGLAVDSVTIDREKNILLFDTSTPRVISVLGRNSLTGEIKEYMLRVTGKGGLCLI